MPPWPTDADGRGPADWAWSRDGALSRCVSAGLRSGYRARWGHEAADRRDWAARRTGRPSPDGNQDGAKTSPIQAYRSSRVVEPSMIGDDCVDLARRPDSERQDRLLDEAAVYPLAHPRCVRSFAPVAGAAHEHEHTSRASPKAAGEPGEVEAVFRHVVDPDGDIVLSTAHHGQEVPMAAGGTTGATSRRAGARRGKSRQCFRAGSSSTNAGLTPNTVSRRWGLQEWSWGFEILDAAWESG